MVDGDSRTMAVPPYGVASRVSWGLCAQPEGGMCSDLGLVFAGEAGFPKALTCGGAQHGEAGPGWGRFQ